jgi:hypothetical protein
MVMAGTVIPLQSAEPPGRYTGAVLQTGTGFFESSS